MRTQFSMAPQSNASLPNFLGNDVQSVYLKNASDAELLDRGLIRNSV